jgi:uncharacterized short protein YbdD (DUF466 family)
MTRTAKFARSAWAGLRALAGDDAYDRYLAHRRERHPGEAELDRREFYLAELDRRWARITRCC